MESIEKTFNTVVLKFLQQFGVSRGSSILIAFSGGPDSTALLSVLTNLKEYDLTITAAYFNHNIRSKAEMDKELSIVKGVAESLKIRLVTGEAAAGFITGKAKSEGLSVEEAARQERYRFLFNEKEKCNADWIATGHNRNDNTETMIMRFFQNAGTAGLSGIPYKRGSILRPLSFVSRDDIELYIKKKNIAFSIDQTNLKTDYLRNRIRHDLIPSVKEIFPELDKNLSALSDKIKAENEFLEQEAARRIQWESCRDGYRTYAPIFYKEPVVIRIRSVFAVMNLLGNVRIKYNAVNQAASQETENGKVLLRLKNIEICRQNNYIYVQRLVNHNKKSYLVILKEEEKQFLFGQEFIILKKDSDYEESQMNTVLIDVFSYKSVIIRSCRDGDSIITENGEKSLKKLFNEWKVNENDRMVLPVIEDKSGIAAVIGKHLGYSNRFACNKNQKEKRLKKIMLVYGNSMESTCERSK